MGIFDSTSNKSGGELGSANTLANDNSGAGAPVFNLADERQGSGKYVTQAANNYTFNVSQTDYGSVEGGLALAEQAIAGATVAASDLITAGAAQNIAISDNLNDLNRDFLVSVEAANKAAQDTQKYLFSEGSRNLREAVNAVERSAQDTRDAYGEANQSIQAMAIYNADQMGELATDTLVALEGANTKTLDAVLKASQSETQQLSETAVKLVMGVAVVALAVPVLMRRASQ